jgi:hypothetical protein
MEVVLFFLLKEAHFYPCSLQVTSRCASRGQWGPLISLNRFVGPVFFSAPAVNFDGIHGCTEKFCRGDWPILPTGRQVWEVFMDQSFEGETFLIRFSENPKETENDHAGILNREFERNVRWQEFAKFTHRQTHLGMAFTIRAESPETIGMKKDFLLARIVPVQGGSEKRLLIPMRCDVRNLGTQEERSRPGVITCVLRATVLVGWCFLQTIVHWHALLSLFYFITAPFLLLKYLSFLGKFFSLKQ